MDILWPGKHTGPIKLVLLDADGIRDKSRKGIGVAPVGLPPVISLATEQLKIFSAAIVEASV